MLVNLTFRSFDDNLFTTLIADAFCVWFCDVISSLSGVESNKSTNKDRCRRRRRRCEKEFAKHKLGKDQHSEA